MPPNSRSEPEITKMIQKELRSLGIPHWWYQIGFIKGRFKLAFDADCPLQLKTQREVAALIKALVEAELNQRVIIRVPM